MLKDELYYQIKDTFILELKDYQHYYLSTFLDSDKVKIKNAYFKDVSMLNCIQRPIDLKWDKIEDERRANLQESIKRVKE